MSTRCTHGHDEHEPCLEAGRYYGAVGDRFESAGAVLSRVVHEKPRALPQHDHALAYFCMLCDGSYVETAAGRELDYKRFEVGFHPARMPHRDEVGARGATFLCLEIHPQPMMDADVRLRRDPALLPGDVSQQMLRLYRALATGTLTGLDLESATWELCGDASGERRSVDRATPQWLRKCLEIIEAEHGEALTVASIAHRVGVHPVHASREFRRRFGQTLGEYVNKVRVRAACEEISRGAPLAQVALRAGFADQAHFCRVFKSAVGCTPSAFADLRYSM